VCIKIIETQLLKVHKGFCSFCEVVKSPRKGENWAIDQKKFLAKHMQNLIWKINGTCKAPEIILGHREIYNI
jgi:hypothetical protein